MAHAPSIERRRHRASLTCPAAVLTAVTSVFGCGSAAAQRYDPAAVTQAICRQYAAAQHAFRYDTMYAQCMYARGYVVPGLSPSPESPGYPGVLTGPAPVRGGQ
jgi:hypothetical protein